MKPARHVRGTTNRENHRYHRLITVAVCLILAEIVLISFWGATGNGFVNFDDNDYVYQNPNVTHGLTLAAVRWAFTSIHASNWHPLTTISHMLDCSLYGLQPWGHHLTNILLHATAAVLLFLALKQLTRTSNSQPSTLSVGASAFVAALFAVHPLRVESVAWISERKDVLSGVFFMLTLLAYAWYARSKRFLINRYLTVTVLFGLGLLCKPSLVTLPFVLLLLDYWPLERWQRATSNEQRAKQPTSRSQRRDTSTSFSGLVTEKIPLFILSAASCVITMIAQREALNTIHKVAFPLRLGNAVISYVAYLGETIYPMRLAVLYPYNEHDLSTSGVILALLLLSLISVTAWMYRKSYPFLLIGWLWFLGTLVPMSGLVQVGWQSRADRYTYLPQIGLWVAVIWGVIELFKKSAPYYRQLSAGAGLLIILLFIVATRVQILSWKDSVTLWAHTVAITPNNYIAYNNLGQALSADGELDQAIATYEKAIRINSSPAEAEYNLGNVFVQKQNVTEAIDHYQKALRIRAAYPEAEFNLGSALLQSGEPYSAIYHYEKAVELKPDSAEMQGRLGSLLARLGRKQAAHLHLEEAVRLKPDYTEAKDQLRELDGPSSP